MVFKPLSHLARRSTKVLAHHAQSITAASSTTTTQHFEKYSHHRFGRSGSALSRDAFHTLAVQQSIASTKSAAAGTSLNHNNDAGLGDYLAAWERLQSNSDEWQQFQFTKRIGWRGSSNAAEISGPAFVIGEASLAVEPGLRAPSVERAYSTNDIEHDGKQSEGADAADAAKINEAIAKEIHGAPKSAEEARASARSVDEVFNDTVLVSEVSEKLAARPSTASPSTARSAPTSTSPVSISTPLSSVDGGESLQYVEHILALERAGSHAEIPAVFEALLQRGVVPPANAYNALVAAAIRLPSSSHQVIPKVLDVYSDMLRRKVHPDATTYTLVLDVLAVRALQVHEDKVSLQQNLKRFGTSNDGSPFLLRSHETESQILAEDDSLAVASKVFDMAAENLPGLVYPASTYQALIEAYATYGDLDQMLRIHAHMELNNVTPFASIYPAMIRAFASSGDLRSAVETYEGYKNMAVADDRGELTLLDRADDEVYAAIVKAYLDCGKQPGADKFFTKLEDVSTASYVQKQRLESARASVVTNAFVQDRVDAKHFGEALAYAETPNLAPATRRATLIRICEAAADEGYTNYAIQAYQGISKVESVPLASVAMLAMHVRQGDIVAARNIWYNLTADPHPTTKLIEPTTMYANALVGAGLADEGLTQARQSFNRIRSSVQGQQMSSESSEMIDEGIEVISALLAEKAIIPSAQASMAFMWAMIENGGLIPGVAEQLLAGLGPEEVARLSWQDLKLALQVEAGIIGSGSARLDIAHGARLAHLLETTLASNMPLDHRTKELVETSLGKIGHDRPDLVAQWQGHINPIARQDTRPQFSGQMSPAVARSPAFNDSFDPHAHTLDQRGSSIIIDELEKQYPSASASLSEALARFRNIRRAGRHPRYIAYAKLIAAAAKDGRTNLVHDILGMAKQDLPLLPQYSVVRHGWVSILDAMVGACLTMGNRRLAGDYHQQLRDVGAAPTANTFGLYITTLKESTKTFDEATEAVKIFHQAKSEGVEPSSFLYNALIGKLGKARRIDDCLFYFAEMRSRSIRPTSVTYGTIVNALCRVSDERFAQELFDEMESMPNYKPRPAPYNSLMQFFLTTKRDSSKVLEYYQRMRSKNIQPTMHTYKLLIDTYATLEPVNLAAAEGVFSTIRATGQKPEAVHYASLIHAQGCVLHDIKGARKTFDEVTTNSRVRPQACLYQALFESMVANHCVKDTTPLLEKMSSQGVEITPYIANTLIHGWALENDISQAKSTYLSIGKDKREPSTYEAMTRAFLAAQDRGSASEVVHEMLSRGYPSAVTGKIVELLGHGMARPTTTTSAVEVAAE